MLGSPRTSVLWSWACLFAWIVTSVSGQETNVTCLANYKWAENSRGQNPCLMAAYAYGTCTGSSFTIRSLPADRVYIGPRRVGEVVHGANQCECSSVTYSLMSACADCQGGEWITWSRWATNCTSELRGLGSFPPGVPDGTSFPAWAFIDPSLADNYVTDTARAFAAQGLPESSHPAPSSTASSTDTASSTSGTPSQTGAPPASGNSSPDIGAIVGGTVGGLAGIAIILGLILFFRHYSIKKDNPDRIQPGLLGDKSFTPTSPYGSPTVAPIGYNSPYSRTSAYSPPLASPVTFNPYDPQNPAAQNSGLHVPMTVSPMRQLSASAVYPAVGTGDAANRSSMAGFPQPQSQPSPPRQDGGQYAPYMGSAPSPPPLSPNRLVSQTPMPYSGPAQY